MPSYFIFKVGNKFITSMGNPIEVRDNFDSNTKVLLSGYNRGNLLNIMATSESISDIEDFTTAYPAYSNIMLTMSDTNQMSPYIKALVSGVSQKKSTKNPLKSKPTSQNKKPKSKKKPKKKKSQKNRLVKTSQKKKKSKKSKKKN